MLVHILYKLIIIKSSLLEFYNKSKFDRTGKIKVFQRDNYV